MTESRAKVYSIQVSGISCINCAANITKMLTQGLADPEVKINVNVMNEKVTLSVNKDQIVKKAIGILKETKYKPLAQAVLISGNAQNERSISFVISKDTDADKLDQELATVGGITHKDISTQEDRWKINIRYDSASVRGRQIAEVIRKYDQHYEVHNDRIESLRAPRNLQAEKDRIKRTIILLIYLLLANMIFPLLPSIESIYSQCVTFPKTFGIYSISVLLNISLTIYVMNCYAKGYIIRAYNNYISFGTTNMETLIALGSVSASGLALFFIVRYTIEQLDHKHKAIMDINHALTSASIIVLVVTIGKYLEKRVKTKISKMTDQIFPESVLFANMKINYVEVKNRNLVILSEKMYDVSLIQKDDVIRVQPGTLLVDAIVISGSAKVIQSARTGSDELITVKKGERIESGATVHEVDSCLAVVQKVIEKSMLIEVVTHVKFNQSDDGEASAIETLCKKIANYFVKGVVVLSITTMIVWSVLLEMELAKVPVCNVCWIIERGIGVLVASCPCALGLAIPSVIANILNLAIKSGILIKNTAVFEAIKHIKMIAFDKTGTLFTKINRIESYQLIGDALSEEKIWEVLTLLQRDVRHPLAEVIYKEAFNMSKISGTNFGFLVKNKELVNGQGLKASLVQKGSHEQINVLVGNKYLLADHGFSLSQLENDKEAHTTIFVSINSKLQIIIYLNAHSNLRPEAIEVMRKIQAEGMKVHILSGDSQGSVNKLGQNLHLDANCLHAEKTAQQKVNWVRQEQIKSKNSIVMVGDGINDIPCLRQSSIGISINAKSELNINAADVIILSENLHKIVALLRFLKKGSLFIRINLFWAFAYNVVIMPIVAGVFFKWNVFVSPVWSAVAMSLSSLIVVAFSYMLTYFHYDDSLPASGINGQPQQSAIDLSSSNREVLTLNEEIS